MWNLSWKLAAVLNGFGGSRLLESYNTEMRPIAMEIIEAVGGHISRQMSYSDLVAENLDVIDKETPEGEAVRARIGAMIRDIGNHGKFFGRELDQRLKSDIIVQDSDKSEEPRWNPLQYTPSTWPGARAPHVWLKDGPTPIFDHYGLWWTLITFQESDQSDLGVSNAFKKATEKVGLPLKTVELVDEHHARKLWGKDFVLVRPDGHVAWRSDNAPSISQIVDIMEVVSGRKSSQTNGHV
jgi:FAD-dependent monooxygenase